MKKFRIVVRSSGDGTWDCEVLKKTRAESVQRPVIPSCRLTMNQTSRSNRKGDGSRCPVSDSLLQILINENCNPYPGSS